MKCLLLVEDDELLREVLELFLEEQGFVVHAAGDAAEALDLMISEGVWPTVILLDLRMPTMDGWDLLEVLDRDRRLAAIPRVVITGERGHGLGDHARTSVLLKPFASADLVREIWRWCDRVAA